MTKMGTQILIFSLLLCSSSASTDYTNLVYRGCANQKFPASDSYTQTLKTLFNSLITQSQTTNFTKTTAGDATQSAIFGLYQCRGDLNLVDCNNCVSQFPKMARKYCGSNSIAARIQLVGCYMRYEIVGFTQVSSTELLYKYCKKGGGGGGVGFEGEREKAFEEVESGVVSGGGFYAASYEEVYVVGQCEGDLAGSECGECVKTGLERVKAECGDAVSGQVYLNQCYISYTYYPNGLDGKKSSSPGTRHGTAKTVAIAMGGTAAAGFVVVILLFTKSALKKKSSKYHHYGG